MIKDQIKIYLQDVECKSCGCRYTIGHEPHDEGFGHAPVLYECDITREVFYHSLEESKHFGPPEIKISEINSIGEFNVRRSHPIHLSCPRCGLKNFSKLGKSRSEFIEATPIYRLTQNQPLNSDG